MTWPLARFWFLYMLALSIGVGMLLLNAQKKVTTEAFLVAVAIEFLLIRAAFWDKQQNTSEEP